MPVYILRAGDTDKVKIGWAASPEARRRDLQTSHWLPLKIIRVIDGAPHTEGWMHRHFRHRHITNEWFEFDDAMMTVTPPAIEELPGKPEVSEIVRLIGGVAEVMAITGTTKTGVRSWFNHGIPLRHWAAILRAAKAAEVPGITLDALRNTRFRRAA